MTSPTVSIIIPAYNQAAYIARAIESVLEQTYEHWELVVVDDGSTDATAQVVAQFTGPRIRLIEQTNKGLPGARNTGIKHASGDHLAFLDADDWYHPEKLALQVDQLARDPALGLSYSGRISVDADGRPLTLQRAGKSATLADLVLGFPFTINDLLMRREWVERVNGFDESYRLNSEDRDFYVRLALAGCRFVPLERFLAYRRLHAGRVYRNVPVKLEQYFRSLETAFSDPRCPDVVQQVRSAAYAEIYKVWACQLLLQGEADLAHAYLAQWKAYQSEWFADGGQRLVTFLTTASTREGGEHEALLRRAFAQLPVEYSGLASQVEWAVARGYLERGLRELIWGRLAEGRALCHRAAQLGATLEKNLAGVIIDQLHNYAAEFGHPAAYRSLQQIVQCADSPQLRPALRNLQGQYLASRAFDSYRARDYRRTLHEVAQAISCDLSQLSNRGVLAIGLRSLWKSAAWSAQRE